MFILMHRSIRGVGCLLAQEVENVLLPIAFCARRMQKAEVNYMTDEQEFLAMVYCFYTWRCYLKGVEFFAHTDHEPLTWLAPQNHINRRQARWMEVLSCFEYTLLYIKGDKNVCADALIRLLDLREHNFQLPGELWPHSHADANSECRRISRRLGHPHEQLSTANRGCSSDSAVGAQHSFTIPSVLLSGRFGDFILHRLPQATVTGASSIVLAANSCAKGCQTIS